MKDIEFQQYSKIRNCIEYSLFLSLDITDHIYEWTETITDKWDYIKLKLFFIDKGEIYKKQYSMNTAVASIQKKHTAFHNERTDFLSLYGMDSSSPDSVVCTCVCIFNNRHFSGLRLFLIWTVMLNGFSCLVGQFWAVSIFPIDNWVIWCLLVSVTIFLSSLHFQDIKCLQATCKCFSWKITFSLHVVFPPK